MDRARLSRHAGFPIETSATAIPFEAKPSDVIKEFGGEQHQTDDVIMVVVKAIRAMRFSEKWFCCLAEPSITPRRIR